MNNNAIIFKNVCFSYKEKKVLNNLSFSIKKGEHICFFGPSGCGKSTIARLICRLEKQDMGEIFVCSKKIRPVFQEDRLLPFLSVKSNISMFTDKNNIDNLIVKLGLAEVCNKYPSNLSGGMSRRVSIARALSGDGEIYIFDEPFNGLDEKNIINATDIILEYIGQKTLICILHSKKQASKLGCRLLEI